MLRTSERGIAFIKKQEGFVKYAVWDVSQWSIGYGSHCKAGEYPNGISREEADELLRMELETEMEPIVAKVERTRGKKFAQCEWDALASLTYNLGSQWANSQYSIYKFIIGEYQMDEEKFIAHFEQWSHADIDGDGKSEQLPGLLRRRQEEARMYLYGDYADGKPYEKEESIMYPKLKNVPAWAHDAVKTLIDLGVIQGTQGEGEDRQIDMTHSECRCCVWMVRYAEKLIKNVPAVVGEVDLNALGKIIISDVITRLSNG